MSDIRPHSVDHTGRFQADPGRQGQRVKAGAMIGVDEIHADGCVPNAYFPGARIRQVDLNHLKNRRVPELGNANGLGHGSVLHGGDSAGIDLGVQDSRPAQGGHGILDMIDGQEFHTGLTGPGV